MLEQTLNIDGVGEVAFYRSVRARNLRITISDDKSVRVTVPATMHLREADRFVRAKIPWLRKHIRRYQQREAITQSLPDLSPEELRQAQYRLFDRLDYFSQKHNLPYNRVAFRCQKTRWGSCSSQNNISLNVNIAFLPEHLQDYVLLHELTHTRIKNHSAEFWSALNRYTAGHARKFARELKRYTMKIQT